MIAMPLEREYRICTTCNYPYVGDNPSQCHLCHRQAMYNARRVGGYAPMPCERSGCAEVFTPARAHQSYCSDSCRKSVWNARERERTRSAKGSSRL